MPTPSSSEASFPARGARRAAIPAGLAALTIAAVTVTESSWGVDQGGAKPVAPVRQRWQFRGRRAAA